MIAAGRSSSISARPRESSSIYVEQESLKSHHEPVATQATVSRGSACSKSVGANALSEERTSSIAPRQQRDEISSNRGGNINGPLARQCVNQCGRSHDSRIAPTRQRAWRWTPTSATAAPPATDASDFQRSKIANWGFTETHAYLYYFYRPRRTPSSSACTEPLTSPRSVSPPADRRTP